MSGHDGFCESCGVSHEPEEWAALIRRDPLDAQMREIKMSSTAEVARLEAVAREAKDAYRDNRDDPKFREAHRRASQELADARRVLKNLDLKALATPGDEPTTTVAANGASAKGKAEI